MEYNTKSEDLIISEYGRNVQNLINHAKTIEDKEKRQRVVEGIVKLMEQMHPHNKNNDDNNEKLWKHLFKIANYDLDVETPMEIVNLAESKPVIQKVHYPSNRIKFRHYGLNIQSMIEKAVKMEDEEQKAGYTYVIASYMKMAYNNWNEGEVNDELIKKDLERLSENQLKLDDSTQLPYVAANRTPANNKKKNFSSNNNRRRNNNNNNRNNNNRRYKN